MDQQVDISQAAIGSLKSLNDWMQWAARHVYHQKTDPRVVEAMARAVYSSDRFRAIAYHPPKLPDQRAGFCIVMQQPRSRSAVVGWLTIDPSLRGTGLCERILEDAWRNAQGMAAKAGYALPVLYIETLAASDNSFVSKLNRTATPISTEAIALPDSGHPKLRYLPFQYPTGRPVDRVHHRMYLVERLGGALPTTNQPAPAPPPAVDSGMSFGPSD